MIERRIGFVDGLLTSVQRRANKSLQRLPAGTCRGKVVLSTAASRIPRIQLTRLQSKLLGKVLKEQPRKRLNQEHSHRTPGKKKPEIQSIRGVLQPHPFTISPGVRCIVCKQLQLHVC